MAEKISVLIVTRNRSEMLVSCINSLAAQTQIPDEVIVVDNASTDNTKEIILSFKKELPIQYIREDQVGIPYARNRGIGVVHGSLILMLDDDCQADKFWIERMVDAHKKYKKAWVVQGRTFSLPKTRPYSLLVEFKRSISLRNYTKKKLPLIMKGFFQSYFKDEKEILTCDTKNLSIKTSYFKKYKLSFDEHFYRGSDADLGRQIVEKNGLIMFCPSVTVAHWERSTLAEFLEQRWHIGRTKARMLSKWKTPTMVNMDLLATLLAFFHFCKIFNQWRNSPIVMVLLLLDRLYYFNGYFFEKRFLKLGKAL